MMDGRVVGYSDLQGAGFIDQFFVSGDFPRRGVGSALMRHIHDVAAERGLSELSTEVSLSAEPFFARHGFLVGERQTVVVRGVALANARMNKRLLELRGAIAPSAGSHWRGCCPLRVSRTG